MSKVTIKKLLIVITSLLILVAGVIFIEGGLNQNNSSSYFLKDLKLSNISKIEYLNSTNSILITRRSDGWYINDFRASNRMIEIAISKLLSLNIEYIASTENNTHSLFEVDDPNNKLIIETENSRLEFFIGKNTYSNGSFIREVNSSSTIALDTSVSSILDYDVNYFRDKVVTSFNPNSVSAINLNNVEYKKQEKEWTDYESNLQKLIIRLSNLEGISIASETDKASISKVPPVYTIDIFTKGNEINLFFYDFNSIKYVKDRAKEDFIVITDSTFQDIDLEIKSILGL